MKSYIITKPNKGYVVRDVHGERGYACTEEYAFSTLKEVQDFMPDLFEPNQMIEKGKKEMTQLIDGSL